MNNRKNALLGELVDNHDNRRVPLSSAQRATLEKLYPYYGAQSVIDYVDNYIFDGEFILVAEDGENLKSQKQKVCQVVTGKFWVNNHAHIISASGKNNTRYLAYLLNLIDFKPYITGSAQPKLTKENLSLIKLTIHEPDAQIKIAAVLSSLDAKIALNHRINGELEGLAKLLYDYWFVQYDFPLSAAQAAALGKPKLAGQPYRTSGGKMLFNPTLKREIPGGWEVDNILAIADLGGGATPSKKSTEFWKGTIPFFTPTDARNEPFCLDTEDHITQEGLSNSSTRLYDEGTLFITARGSVGKAMIISKEMAMNQSCYALIPREGVGCAFLYFHTLSLMGFLHAKSSGSVFKSIVTNDIKFTPAIVPKSEILKEFSTFTEPLFDQILNNQRQNQELTALRDWLLPMLMNGQVRVV